MQVFTSTRINYHNVTGQILILGQFFFTWIDSIFSVSGELRNNLDYIKIKLKCTLICNIQYNTIIIILSVIVVF